MKDWKETRKANKEYGCMKCGSSIAKGSQYFRRTYPLMRGCSPEKQPDDVWCLSCCPSWVKRIERVAA